MGLLDRKEQKSRKKWLLPIALLGAVAAAVGLKKKRRSPDAD